MKSLTKELITKSLPHAKKYKEEITTLRKLLHTYGVAKVRINPTGKGKVIVIYESPNVIGKYGAPVSGFVEFKGSIQATPAIVKAIFSCIPSVNDAVKNIISIFFPSWNSDDKVHELVKNFLIPDIFEGDSVLLFLVQNTVALVNKRFLTGEVSKSVNETDKVGLRDIMTKLIKKGLTVEEIRQVFDEVVTEIVIVS